jgi:Mrp family chromosome partitioning ATPase
MGLVGREGLKEALLARELNGSVSPLAIANLSAVPVGVDPRVGPENVRRADLEKLLGQVRDRFDIILVDTGPMLGSLESTPVTAAADGVVLSVRRGRSRSRLEECVARIQTMGTRCVGVILNCALRSDCNRYVSEASLAAAEEDRATRDPAGGQAEAARAGVGERNALVRAMQSHVRSKQSEQ